ncbi:MAG: efflux RND transporter permease subunit [Deltaproteobacteria bacterium]|jgi:multidrug efflux pump subunit AcrB|nr:efflux RND transporter permease subunit [Deltaproteobacteria bacterium]
MNIAKFSVKQPVLVNLLTLFILFAGYLSLNRLPREAFPNITVGRINVRAFYPGVSPEEIESLVGIKIEREIKDIRGIEKMTVFSEEGTLNVVVETLEDLPESEVSRIGLDIQAAVGRISDFPSDMDKPVVQVARMEVPVVYLGLNSSLPEMDAREIAKDIRDQLEDKEGVSTVEVFGLRDLQIKVEVDPDKMKGYNLSLQHIMQIIQAHKQDIPGGSVKLKKGEYLIRVLGQKTSVKDIGNLIIRATNGGVIRINDVANVSRGMVDPITVARVHGKRSIYFVVNKKQDADAIKLTYDIKEFFREYLKNAPQGLGINYLFEAADFIKARQNTLISNGILGLVLVVILLFIFLSFKTAIMTALGIPIAFMGTFIVMHFIGITFNMMSMFGLIIALGMIVDDAIVVVENIYRYLMKGMDPKKAAIKGANEVFWPVIGSVSTTVVAFSTLTFMPGVMGKMLSIISAVVAIALTLSLIEALFVLPSHMADFMKKKKVKKQKGGEEDSAEAGWFLTMRRGYTWLLELVTRFWPISIGLFIFVLGYTVYFAKTNMEFVPFPSHTIRRVTFNMETTLGSKLEYTEEAVKVIEKYFGEAEDTEVESFYCNVGSYIERGHVTLGTHLMQCRVNFYEDGETYPRKPMKMVNKWRKQINELSEVENLNLVLMRAGPASGDPIDIQVMGKNYQKLGKLAAEIRNFAAKIEGVTDVNTDLASGKREIQVEIDQDRAAVYGFNPAVVGMMIRRAFAGGIAAKIQEDDEDIDVVVQYPENRRRNISEIENMKLISPVSGKRVPFKAFGKLTAGRGPGRLIRIDTKKAVSVYGEIDPTLTNVTRVNNELRKYTDKLQAENPEVKIHYGGETEVSEELYSSLVMALLIAFMSIYIILATIFGSFLQPFIVLMAVPFGAVGVVFGLNFHGLPISMMGMMGMVALLGVVVNDSLVMVDFINNEKDKGSSTKIAVIEGGKLRLRPVLLTTITTIFGLAPMAAGILGGEEFLEPMAISMAWGLGFATTLTLFLVPSVYLMIDWFKSKGNSLINLIKKPFSKTKTVESSELSQEETVENNQIDVEESTDKLENKVSKTENKQNNQGSEEDENKK